MAATARTPGSRPCEASRRAPKPPMEMPNEADPAKVVALAAQERNKLLHQHRLGVAAVGAGGATRCFRRPPQRSRRARRRRRGAAGGRSWAARVLRSRTAWLPPSPWRNTATGNSGCAPPGGNVGCSQRPTGGDPGAESRDERTCARPESEAAGAGSAVGSGWHARRGAREAGCQPCRRRARTRQADSCQLKQPAPGQGRLVHSSI